MAIDYRRLLDWPVPEVRQTYSVRDSQRYALAVGLGADPVDTRQLPFVYEHNPQALPMQAVVLGYPGFWMKDPATGVDWVRLVHAEQGLRLHRPLPASGEVIGRTRVVGINDKGPGKGAIVYSQRTLHDAVSDALIATLDSSTFCRGDGGCGGSDAPPMRLAPTPEREPDAVCELPTLPQQALLYRQCGDFNPLHADPAVARAAGFERPILHGLCTFAVAGHALVRLRPGTPDATAGALLGAGLPGRDAAYGNLARGERRGVSHTGGRTPAGGAEPRPGANRHPLTHPITRIGIRSGLVAAAALGPAARRRNETIGAYSSVRRCPRCFWPVTK